MDLYCLKCESQFEDTKKGKCTKCGSRNTEIRDCLSCKNSYSTDDYELYCVEQMGVVDEDGYCDGYNE